MKKRFYSALMALIFAVFAIVQLNDPDPIIWVFAYSLPGIFFSLSLFLRLPKYIPVIGGVAFACLFVGLSFNVGNWSIENELAREAGGILMTAGAFFIYNIFADCAQ